MIALVLMIISIVLLLCSIKKNDKNFDKTSTDIMKGFSIIIIVVHHMLNHWSINNSLLMSLNSHFGYMFTCVFFLLSGYGVTLSYNKKEKNIKYLLQKIFNIYKYFIIYYIITILMMCILSETILSIKDLLLSIITLTLPNCSTWFIKVLIGCYIVTFVSSKISIKNKSYIAIVPVILYILICIIYKLPEKYYLSVSGYFVGGILAENLSYLIELSKIKREKIIIYVILVILTMMLFIFNKFIYIKIVFAALFSITFFLSLLFVNYNNKVLEIIGKNTLYIYFCHLGIIYIFDNIIDNIHIKELCFLLLLFITIVVERYINNYLTVKKVNRYMI